MALLLRLPSLSPTMESGAISLWKKKVGDHVDVGEVLAEIETDKAVMEWEMADEGFLREILLELVRWADILIENFAPRVMPALGLAYPTLKEVNPSLIMISIS